MRLCLDRIASSRKDCPVTFTLPKIETTADVTKATQARLEAVVAGGLTPGEAAELGRLVVATVEAPQRAIRGRPDSLLPRSVGLPI